LEYILESQITVPTFGDYLKRTGARVPRNLRPLLNASTNVQLGRVAMELAQIGTPLNRIAKAISEAKAARFGTPKKPLRDAFPLLCGRKQHARIDPTDGTSELATAQAGDTA
jgi:hypothetical protein